MDINISSQQVEKAVISGFLRSPEKLLELIHIISEKDFFYNPHPVIFSIIKDCASNNRIVDPIIIAERIKSLGITYKANISIYDYLTSLSFIKINDRALGDACKQLVILRIRREIYSVGESLKSAMISSGDVEADKIISIADKIYNERILSYNISEKPRDIFEDVIEKIEERALNPKEEIGFKTPFSKFNEFYGGLRGGNVYCFVSRGGVGKSTLLNQISFRSSVINSCKTLFLDTEMVTEDILWRSASAITGIPMWFLETGNWKHNAELRKKFEIKKEDLIKAKGYIEHMNVAGVHIQDVISLIQRWYYGQIGRGNPAIVVYDYIKLTGESEYNKKEYELIGEKVDKLKQCSLRLDIPILTACQLNRTAEAGVDDSSAIAQSDRLLWYATYVGIFRRKTLEEQAEDGLQFGTHKLIELKGRFQGKNSQGHSNVIKCLDAKGKVKYKYNFINYEVDNFAVEEKGTLQDIIDAHDVNIELDEENHNDSIL